MDSPGHAGLAFQDVDDDPKDAEHRNPGGLESQFAHMNIPDDDRHECRPVTPDGHAITAEAPLDPSTDPQSLRPPENMSEENAIAFIRVTLQVAVAGLKAAPIPTLDQIPEALLLLINTYEVSYPAILPGVPSGSIG